MRWHTWYLFPLAIVFTSAMALGESMSVKKVIAFDLDDTLAVTKSPITPRMAGLLTELMDRYEVCVISGGKFGQFKTQVVDQLSATPKQLARLHLMPTSGTRYYRYDVTRNGWQAVYEEDLTADQKQRITDVARASAEEVGLWPSEPYGPVIEDRGSQISMSLLGQNAPAEKKYEWAKKNSAKREELRALVASRLPEFEVRAGGTTTLDITRKGIDKAYGMAKLLEHMSIGKADVLFVGDKLEAGGNDYPVKAFGIESIAVRGWEDTALLLEGIIAVSPRN
jgi:phosphomannomutase